MPAGVCLTIPGNQREKIPDRKSYTILQRPDLQANDFRMNTPRKTDIPPLPEAFSRRIREQFPGEYPAFIAAHDQSPLTSIRLNPHKWDGIQHKPDFIETANQVPWSKNGCFLQERPSFTLDPLFHAGCYYVQEASSMFLEHILSRLAGLERADVILDACAAPGGKTTLLAALLPESMIVANEVIRSRVSPLIENSIKWGTGNIVVTQNNPSRFAALNGFFDLILADAPCSGEGLFRKDPASRTEWSPENAYHCSLRQRSILTDLWPALRPGGYLIYTTCTFNPEENERNVAWLLDKTGGECLRVDMPADTALRGAITEITDGPVTGYGFYPHRSPGEGFFLSMIRKPESDRFSSSDEASATERAASRAPDRNRGYGRTHYPGGGSSPIQAADYAAVRKAGPWFRDTGFDWYQIRERLFRIRSNHLHTLRQLSSVLTVRYAGTEAGRVIRDDVHPAAASALDINLNTAVFPQIECSLDDALRFLRRENLPVPPGAETGWHLIMYQGLPLGWTKNIGSRMNNYHPSEWRIRK